MAKALQSCAPLRTATRVARQPTSPPVRFSESCRLRPATPTKLVCKAAPVATAPTLSGLRRTPLRRHPSRARPHLRSSFQKCATEAAMDAPVSSDGAADVFSMGPGTLRCDLRSKAGGWSAG
eukprot:362074-Chlamydomonas_euryale.AAC.2